MKILCISLKFENNFWKVVKKKWKCNLQIKVWLGKETLDFLLEFLKFFKSIHFYRSIPSIQYKKKGLHNGWWYWWCSKTGEYHLKIGIALYNVENLIFFSPHLRAYRFRWCIHNSNMRCSIFKFSVRISRQQISKWLCDLVQTRWIVLC